MTIIRMTGADCGYNVQCNKKIYTSTHTPPDRESRIYFVGSREGRKQGQVKNGGMYVLYSQHIVVVVVVVFSH